MSERFIHTWNSVCFMLILLLPLLIKAVHFQNTMLLILLLVIWSIPMSELIICNVVNTWKLAHSFYAIYIVNRGILYVQSFIFSIIAIVFIQYQVHYVGFVFLVSIYVIIRILIDLPIIFSKKNTCYGSEEY